MIEASELAARVRAVLRLISPEHITPLGVMMVEKVLDAAPPAPPSMGTVCELRVEEDD
jgi:hypothetical protein